MAWHVKEYYADGSIDVSLDDAPIDILDVMKQGIETGSQASGINQSTGMLELYWFIKSPTPLTDGTWIQIG